MTGVEILAMEEVATKFAYNWTVFLIVAGVFFSILTVAGFIIMTSNCGSWKDLLIGAIIGLLVGAGFGAIAGSGEKTPTEYETQYKVTISDEVPMNDFLERYEIIDQEGKIYTVRDRNEAD